MKFPQLILHNQNTETANLILHGGSKGIESEFIQKLFDASVKTGATTLAFNFPYLDRGEENSSGDELMEEVQSLSSAIDLLKTLGGKRINIIAKSLGGIVASYYLTNKERDLGITFSLFVLGYVVEDVKVPIVDLDKFVIIQGEKDRFGDAEKVESRLQKHSTKVTHIINVPAADHSFRDEQKNPIYEDRAIEELFKYL